MFSIDHLARDESQLSFTPATFESEAHLQETIKNLDQENARARKNTKGKGKQSPAPMSRKDRRTLGKFTNFVKQATANGCKDRTPSPPEDKDTSFNLRHTMIDRPYTTMIAGEVSRSGNFDCVGRIEYLGELRDVPGLQEAVENANYRPNLQDTTEIKIITESSISNSDKKAFIEGALTLARLDQKSRHQATGEVRHGIERRIFELELLQLKTALEQRTPIDISSLEKEYTRIFNEGFRHPDIQAKACIGLLSTKRAGMLAGRDGAANNIEVEDVKSLAAIALQRAIEPNTVVEAHLQIARMSAGTSQIIALMQGLKFANNPELRYHIHLALAESYVQAGHDTANLALAHLNTAASEGAKAKRQNNEIHYGNEFWRKFVDQRWEKRQIHQRDVERRVKNNLVDANFANASEPHEAVRQARLLTFNLSAATVLSQTGPHFMTDPAASDHALARLPDFGNRSIRATANLATYRRDERRNTHLWKFVQDYLNDDSPSTVEERELFVKTPRGAHFLLIARTLLAQQSLDQLNEDTEPTAHDRVPGSTVDHDRKVNIAISDLDIATADYQKHTTDTGRNFSGDALAEAHLVLSRRSESDIDFVKSIRRARRHTSNLHLLNRIAAAEGDFLKKNIQTTDAEYHFSLQGYRNDQGTLKRLEDKLLKNNNEKKKIILEETRNASSSRLKESVRIVNKANIVAQQAMVDRLISASAEFSVSDKEKEKVTALQKLIDSNASIQKRLLDMIPEERVRPADYQYGLREARSSHLAVDSKYNNLRNGDLIESRKNPEEYLGSSLLSAGDANWKKEFITGYADLGVLKDQVSHLSPVKRQVIQFEAERQHLLLNLAETTPDDQILLKVDRYMSWRKTISGGNIGAQRLAYDQLEKLAQQVEGRENIDSSSLTPSELSRLVDLNYAMGVMKLNMGHGESKLAKKSIEHRNAFECFTKALSFNIKCLNRTILDNVDPRLVDILRVVHAQTSPALRDVMVDGGSQTVEIPATQLADFAAELGVLERKFSINKDASVDYASVDHAAIARRIEVIHDHLAPDELNKPGSYVQKVAEMTRIFNRKPIAGDAGRHGQS